MLTPDSAVLAVPDREVVRAARFTMPPGTAEAPCGSGCGKTLLISPAARKVLDRTGAVPLCRTCAGAHVVLSALLCGTEFAATEPPETTQESRVHREGFNRRN